MGTFLVGLGRHNERGCPAPRSPACALLPEPAQLYENSGTGVRNRPERLYENLRSPQRNVTFFVTARSNPQVTAAIFDAVGLEAVWEPSVDHDGSPRQGASVCELTSLIEDHKLPDGTRLVVRREPLHPGAQRSLFPSLEFRYWGFYTDAEGTPADLDAIMRAHAHVEQHIARLKDSGLCRFPFTSFSANANWMMTVAIAADLLRWFQLLCMDGTWVSARPKALRWGVLHIPGRLVTTGRRRVVRVIDGWPGTHTVLGAHRRIAALTSRLPLARQSAPGRRRAPRDCPQLNFDPSK